MEKTYRYVMCGVAIMMVLAVVMLFRIHSRVVVSIDGFDLRGTDTVKVGRGSGVSISQIPSDYLTITCQGDSFEWRVSERCLRNDSLCYVLINGDNPNRHPLDDSQNIEVNKGHNNYRLAVSELKSLLSDNKSQYVLLRNAIEKHRRAQAGDSVNTGTDYRELQSLKSFLYRTKSGFPFKRLGPWQLVILDTATRITGTGDSIYFKDSGTVSGYCNLEFFHLNKYRFKSDEEDMFQIGDIKYLATPTLLTTDWGASHVMLSSKGDNHSTGGNGRVLTVRYPKPITWSEDRSKLLRLVSGQSSVVTLRQSDRSIPVGHDVVVPRFSSRVPTEVCQLHTDGHRLVLGGHDLSPRWPLLPIFPSQSLSVGGATLHMHAGTIGLGWVLSYLWLPLIIALVVGFTYPRLVKVGNNLPKSMWADDLPRLWRMVLAIALAYCFCRAAIAIKLSWTYPYFEKMSAISVVSGGLMLTLLFILSLLLNHGFLTLRPFKQKSWRKRVEPWVAVAVGAVAVALCVVAMLYTDAHGSNMVLASYTPSEHLALWPFDTRLLWPISWTDIDSVNELHRSVPLTLLFFCLIGLLLLVCFNLFGKPSFKFHDWIKWPKKTRFKWLSAADANALLVASFYALIAMFFTSLPGNYTTALITLSVVTGIGYAFERMDYKSISYVSLAVSIVIVVLLVCGALGFKLIPSADLGYVTNLVGLLCLTVLLFMAVRKKVLPGNEGASHRLEVRNVKFGAVGIFLLILLVLPMISRLLFNPEDVGYDRTPRRFMLQSQFEDYLGSGYRYAVSDGEFMMVMTHSMYNTSGEDPLSSELHYLHPSVSTGLSPVVLNDLSAPVAFFGTYGVVAYVLYFGLAILLLVGVSGFTLWRLPHRLNVVDATMAWRLIAVFMWMGTTYYLFSSYVCIFPFTGRLNPGLGIDSVGEILESTFLLSFMTATLLKERSSTNN